MSFSQQAKGQEEQETIGSISITLTETDSKYDAIEVSGDDKVSSTAFVQQKEKKPINDALMTQAEEDKSELYKEEASKNNDHDEETSEDEETNEVPAEERVSVLSGRFEGVAKVFRVCKIAKMVKPKLVQPKC